MRATFSKTFCTSLWITLILAFSGLLFMVLGCGGANSRHISVKDKNGMSKNIEATGEVSVRGSTPSLIVLFQAENGTTYTVQSSPVAGELTRLEGMRLVVEGEARTPTGEGPPLLDVKTYRILPFESGDEPIVGRISVVDGGCTLKEADGTEWLITGTFVRNLLSFNGAKLWVIGKRWEKDPSKREIRVTGYGVLARE